MIAIKQSLIFGAAIALLMANSANGSPFQEKHEGTTTVVDKLLVEASCGQCKLGLKGTGCDLAVRIYGKSYYVDGVNIDDHGDAHAADGMCNAIRMAVVSGKIKNGRFMSTAFKMMPSTNEQLVEASCGQCKFGLEGTGCDLAVRIDGKAYYVDGSKIDDHGDAHGDDGMCNAIRRAKVIGEIKDGRFVATSFKVLPHAKEVTCEASCGECQFGLEGDGCDLAVRIDGKAYYVDGAQMDDFGDAHGAGGMCGVVRTAKVRGKIVEGRFVSTSFKLLPFNGTSPSQKPRLGIALRMDGTTFEVGDVMEGTAANRAGLKIGDQFISVNKTKLAGLSREDSIALFRKGPKLDFVILRDGKELKISVNLKGK